MNLFRYLLPLAVIAALLSLSACADDATDDGSGSTPFNASALLSNYGNSVVTADYALLETRALALQVAAQNLNTNRTVGDITACQTAWRDAREQWENSEAFLFGPVEANGIDPRIDTWPLNSVDMDAILAGSSTLDAAFFASASDDVKGYHSIERLVFGNATSVTTTTQILAELNGQTRRYAYLVGACADLAAAVTTLHTAWKSTGGNFVDQIANPGPGKVYVSQKAAILEWLEGMVGIADEVGSGKIATPFGPPADITAVESRYALNSRTDFANNITGIQDAYLGNSNGFDGPGLEIFVSSRDASLDLLVRQRIAAAIAAINAIPVSFEDAITNNRPAVQAAIDAVLLLRDTLDIQLRALINGAQFE
jgi:predicted lipoprotein